MNVYKSIFCRLVMPFVVMSGIFFATKCSGTNSKGAGN